MLFSEIEQFVKNINIASISSKRKALLNPLIAYIQTKVSNNQVINLHFICTHNSRRSHFAQVWAQTLATYFNIKAVNCYSGGTEVTAVFPMVTETLQDSGFNINKLATGKNPIYSIKFAENIHPIIGFSKKVEHAFNPKSEFAAIMTCNAANEACPIVLGAEKRFPITFDDPKAFDNTPQQKAKYQERSLQIATDLFYIFSQLKA
ncbi:MAG: low molecular weight phosphatase family protein [Oceanihabitans sp.]